MSDLEIQIHKFSALASKQGALSVKKKYFMCICHMKVFGKVMSKNKFISFSRASGPLKHK